ncbi:MAG TPA: MarR family winged helix-turn-helix transcriptional regulator [Alphaproteobacteria bacterium]|nr:MarR family winged helix-turn-helix transcriptional regulator [Alphaproteobacteria bacterium]
MALSAGDTTTFLLERFLPYRLSVLTNLMSRAFARSYGRRFGLTIPEWRAMAVLGRFAPLSANEICQRTAMDKVRVSRAVARLKKAGLVERSTDRADRRRSALRLSAAGRRIHGDIVPLARAIEARLLADLTASEIAALDRLVAKLMARVTAMDAESDPAGIA